MMIRQGSSQQPKELLVLAFIARNKDQQSLASIGYIWNMRASGNTTYHQ